MLQWDAVLHGRLPSSGDIFPQISRPMPMDYESDYELDQILRNPPPSRNSLIAQLERDVEEANTKMKELLPSDIEFEQFINAELRNSQMSLDIQPRSSYFENLPNAVRNKGNGQLDNEPSADDENNQIK